MSVNTYTQEQIDEIVRQHKAKKITGDMLNGRAVVERMLTHKQPAGTKMPWSWLDSKFELRPGELTLLAGANGSGKSMLAGQVVAWAMSSGMRSFIASFEMRPIETARRMITQCAGGDWDEDYARWWAAQVDDLIWTWDIMDVVKAATVLERVEAVTEHLSANIVVIDSLLKCGLPQDSGNGYQAQADFVDRLQHASKHLNVHIILVVHMRKPSPGQASTKYDIRGASQISDLADNVLLLKVNEKKREVQRLLEIGQEIDRDEERYLTKPDAVLEVAKQRHGAWEGLLSLDFDPGSLLFKHSGDMRRIDWPWTPGGPRWD